MKNNRGFTIMELILSFLITMIVAVLLFELSLNLKNLYINSGAKTELLIKQANMTKKIYDDFFNKTITGLQDCNQDCIEFEFNDGTSKKLTINRETKVLNYGNYGVKLLTESEIGKGNIKLYTNYDNIYNENDSYFIVNIPITHPLYEDDEFGINVVYQYNSNNTYLIDVDF